MFILKSRVISVETVLQVVKLITPTWDYSPKLQFFKILSKFTTV